jgi:hypothetical protein
VTAHPRDPRLRRQAGGVFAPPVDPLAAAVRLEVAIDAMRAQQLDRGPEPADVAAAVQLAPTSLTAQQFADALNVDEYAVEAVWSVDEVTIVTPELAAAVLGPMAESPEPAPVESLPPAPPVSAPEPPAPAPADTAERADSNRAATVADHRPAGPASVFISEQGRSLTWRSRHDPRSLAYGIRPRLAGSAPITDHLWPVGPVLDQGAEGECVGCAVVDAANVLARCAPLSHTVGLLTQDDAARIYKRAQQLDEVPGEDYSGTSVLAGMKAGVEAGLFGSYRWAFGTRDVAQAVLQVGPVVVGVPWLSGMYDTGPGGLVTLAGDDTGAGHCLAMVGIRRKGPQGQPGPYFVWQNSWGPGYGDGGLGYIHHRDLAELLHGTGEAAIPMPGPPRV